MPLSDVFKKSPKKEPPKDDPLGSPEMQKKRYEAAMELISVLQQRFFSPDGKAHAGTVLSTAARLAGSSLFRSLNYQNDITPGTVILSEEVNQKWPQLMNLFAFYCKQNGIDVMSKPLVTAFPEQDKPRLETAQVLQEFQDRFHEIMKKHELDYLDGARAGMIACAIILQYHSTVAKDIDPHVGTGIVAMGVVEGAKTAPPPLDSGPLLRERNDKRLVLGELETAIQEARANGGVYIHLHPEVLRTLKAKNIDPYLIYERGLMQQIEEKIPRIDFVKANVDELFNEWKSTPESQAPIHVRLILWLKKNAKAYGYEQEVNSWILK